ncbi:DUF1501 domain-containing protein [Pseudooctadecabacter jejudonensis]|uniref:DUF1501 domain-containing protein n=1 Tax=Pseudooctadecabacter jejudonensis TaxID=1391910 RepID=A0A1Y5RR40_9RHOB|nr:DUF1501 domain-containing protein [Pseudooctadecabacter jejudonensis]SLN20535.1 hypothetical protein PSJ8397_00768 [Pseudooctadecabacter jejudonensis]
MSHSKMNRRAFLSALGVGAASLPMLSLPGFVQAANATPTGGNTLVLVELAGGNDGLNSVVPITDPAYRGLRPTIGINTRDALMLDRDTGLHPSLRGMADLWEAGEAQIIEGVGYPDPNRSHFRSIEIWNAGMGADSHARDGWVSRGSVGAAAFEDTDAAGLVLGGDMGPLAGAGRFSAMRDEDLFRETMEYLPDVGAGTGGHAVRPVAQTSPLDHVLKSYDSAQVTGDAILRKLSARGPQRWWFPETELGAQLRTAARLLDAGVQVPVLKVVQGGYDTHDAQPDEHAFLLEDLGTSIAAFAGAMRDAGLWGNVTVVTYSEFGRTARENASAGTDHGTAAPVFVSGGAVRGGLSGARPDLTRLVDGDLAHTTDYRHVYQAILRDLWRIDGVDYRAGPSGLRLLG